MFRAISWTIRDDPRERRYVRALPTDHFHAERALDARRPETWS